MKRNHKLIGTIEILSVVLLIFFTGFPTNLIAKSFFSVFQERDILRSIELLRGHLIFFGPETTGGGNLPGAFYYFLLAPPLFISKSWHAVWCWSYVLFVVAALSGWLYLKFRFDRLVAYLWVFAFSLLAFPHSLLFISVNPSFTPVFLVLINILFLEAFGGETDSHRGKAFILICILIGLTVQIHYSASCYLLSILVLQAWGPRISISRIGKKYFLLGCVASVSLFIPYFVWEILVSKGITVGQLRPYSGKIENAIPSLLWHMKDLSIVGGQMLIWKKLFVILPIGALLGVPFSTRTIKERAPLKIQFINVIAAFIPFSFYFFAVQGFRYSVPLFTSFCFFAAFLLRESLSKKNSSYWREVLMAVGCGVLALTSTAYSIQSILFFLFLILVAVLLYWFSERSLSKSIFLFLWAFLCLCQSGHQYRTLMQLHAGSSLPNYSEWQKIWKKIDSEGLWSYSKLRDRLYFVNHNIEQSIKIPFLEFQATRNHEIKGKKPDGFIISLPVSKEKFDLNWLLNQPIQKEIKTGLQNGDIVLGDFDPTSPLVIPYFVRNAEDFPKHFHNVSLAYEVDPYEGLFQADPGNKIIKLGPNKFLFQWNECPHLGQNCNIGFIIQIEKRDRTKFSVGVEIIGQVLSQSSSWVSPAWTQLLIKPFFQLRCTRSSETQILISSLGYNPSYIGRLEHFGLATTNNSLLAPLKRTFHLNCIGEPSEIIAGWKSSEVQMEPLSRKLPAQELRLFLK